jgi:hypothetical protein
MLPLFFLRPIWLVLVIVGVVLLISARFRYLSSYLILGSTGLMMAVVAQSSLEFFWISIDKVFHLSGDASFFGGLAMMSYLAGPMIAGCLGVYVGVILARKLNRMLGWKNLDATRIIQFWL